VKTVERQKEGCQQAPESVVQALAQEVEGDDRAQVGENGDGSSEEDEEGQVVGEQETESVQGVDSSDEKPDCQVNRLEGEMEIKGQGGIVEEMGVEVEDAGYGTPESPGLEDRGGFFEEIGQPAFEAVDSGKAREKKEKEEG